MNIQIIDTHIPICFLLFHVLATVSPCPRSDSRWLIHCQRQLNVDWMRIAGVYDSNHQAVINSCCATTIKPGRAYHKLSLLSRFSHWAWHFFRFPILFFLFFHCNIYKIAAAGHFNQKYIPLQMRAHTNTCICLHLTRTNNCTFLPRHSTFASNQSNAAGKQKIWQRNKAKKETNEVDAKGGQERPKKSGRRK